VLLACRPSAGAAAQDPASRSAIRAGNPAGAEEIQEIEEVPAVEVPGRLSLADLAGRMHPAAVHFPIGWLVLLFGVEAVALLTGNAGWSRAGLVLLAATTASFIPAAITGLLRASALGNDPEFLETMALHRNLTLGAAAACAVALALRVIAGKDFRGTRRLTDLVLVAVGTFLVLVAGHLGGKMVFGEDYLPF